MGVRHSDYALTARKRLLERELMAQKTLIQLVDDLDGTPIPDGEGSTVSFALNGSSYEIDLGATNTQALSNAFAPYIAAGRRTGRKGRSAATGTKSDPAELQVIREWARANGHDVSDRGRVSGTIRDAYNAAH